MNVTCQLTSDTNKIKHVSSRLQNVLMRDLLTHSWTVYYVCFIYVLAVPSWIRQNKSWGPMSNKMLLFYVPSVFDILWFGLIIYLAHRTGKYIQKKGVFFKLFTGVAFIIFQSVLTFIVGSPSAVMKLIKLLISQG